MRFVTFAREGAKQKPELSFRIAFVRLCGPRTSVCRTASPAGARLKTESMGHPRSSGITVTLRWLQSNSPPLELRASASKSGARNPNAILKIAPLLALRLLEAREALVGKVTKRILH